MNMRATRMMRANMRGTAPMGCGVTAMVCATRPPVPKNSRAIPVRPTESAHTCAVRLAGFQKWGNLTYD